MAASASSREPLFSLRFAMLWAYAFIPFFSAFQLLPAIPLHILELGGSKAQAGWFLTVYTLCSAFAAPVMGTIADHVGRRRLLITASILFVGFSVAYGVIHDLRLLLLVGAIHGSMWSGILASASAIMSEFIPESRRAQGLAWWGLSSTAAVSLAPAAGLWIFHLFGWVNLCIEAVLYPSLALVPIAFAILAVSKVRWEMMTSAILFGICFGLAYPAFATFILGNTDPMRRARTFGSMVWAFDTGLGTGSFAIGAIGQRHGLGAAFGFAAALSCLAIPILPWTSRRLSSAPRLARQVTQVSSA